MSGPLVSIGIPTRNRAELLERALRSALAQQEVELEIVVSDNASTDGTAAVCEALAATEPRLRVLHHPRDIGAERNFRSVLEAARGSLFMWLADDDWLDPGYVAACVSVLDAHPDHVVVCGRARYYRGDEYAFAERPVNLLSSSPHARLLGFYRTVTLNGTFYGVIRRDPLLHIPAPTGLASDWLLVAALTRAGKIRTLDDVSIHRSVAGASQDHASLARAYGLSRRQAWHVHLLVAAKVFQDVRRGRAYRGATRQERLILGSIAAAVVTLRFWPKAMGALLLTRLGCLERARRNLEARRRSRES